MKKKMMILVILLITLIILPNSVEAAKMKINFSSGANGTCQESKISGNVKTTECDLVLQNLGTDTSKGLVLDIVVDKGADVTAVTFNVDSSKGVLNPAPATDTKNYKYNVSVNPIAGGDEVTLAKVTFIATASGKDCGGDIDVVWNGANVKTFDTSDAEVVQSGYAIPYIALAVGMVGVIGFIAVSKKKTKMYKI